MVKKEATHIRVEPQVKRALDKRKRFPQEPYSIVIEEMFNEIEQLKTKEAA